MQESLASLASGLVDHGDEVVVISTALPSGPSTLKEGGVEFHFLDGAAPESYESGFFERAYEEFERQHQVDRFDLVFSESVAAAGFCNRISIPLVARFHGIWIGWRPSESLYFPEVWKVLRAREKTHATRRLPSTFYYGTRLSRMARLVFESASRIVLDSEFSRRLLQGRMPAIDRDRMVVVPPSVDTHRFEPGDRQAARLRLGLERPTLLFVSRMTIAKGPRVAIQAVEALEPGLCDLLMVGTGQEAASLERYVATKKIENIRFAGLVAADDLPDYFKAADLLIYPELSSPAFGLVGAEALACGTPVIGSYAGAIPEVIGDCGYLFPRGDVDGLTRLISKALAAPQTLREMGQRGRERVTQRFSRERMVGMMLAAFEGAVSHNLGRG
jgi:glycosyltransferase involved in cell wall biosynthesis